MSGARAGIDSDRQASPYARAQIRDGVLLPRPAVGAGQCIDGCLACRSRVLCAVGQCNWSAAIGDRGVGIGSCDRRSRQPLADPRSRSRNPLDPLVAPQRYRDARGAWRGLWIGGGWRVASDLHKPPDWPHRINSEDGCRVVVGPLAHARRPFSGRDRRSSNRRRLGGTRKRREKDVPLLLDYADAVRPGYTRTGHGDARRVQELAVRANTTARVEPNPN